MQPIRVDTVTGWWEIGGIAADTLAGVGAIGALIIAARVYRRQVDDARARRASLVILSISSEFGEQAGPDMSARLIVENHSDLPIYELEMTVWYPPDWKKERLQPVMRMVGHGRHVVSLGSDYDERELDAEITFTDTSGHRWRRTVDGQLTFRKMGRMSRCWARVQGWLRRS